MPLNNSNERRGYPEARPYLPTRCSTPCPLSQVLPLNAMVSTTSVSPSHLAMESSIHRGSGSWAGRARPGRTGDSYGYFLHRGSPPGWASARSYKETAKCAARRREGSGLRGRLCSGGEGMVGRQRQHGKENTETRRQKFKPHHQETSSSNLWVAVAGILTYWRHGSPTMRHATMRHANPRRIGPTDRPNTAQITGTFLKRLDTAQLPIDFPT